MAEQPTCGQGLAAHSPLPAKLGDLTAAVADVLEAHTAALDPDDENARAELDAYQELVAEHRQTAADLRSTSEKMRGHRDLPMGPHDPSAMTASAAVDAFARFVAGEEELLALLQDRLGQDRELLAAMRRAA
jgi:hypothetical protein